jgi:hypothetical protein
MSRSNRRRVDCYHEADHAVMAFIEGVTIQGLRLVPDDETGKHSATTVMACPGTIASDWTLYQVVGYMRIAIAGPEGERFGPIPVSTTERQYAKSEQTQHFLEAMQYAKQLGGGRINDTEIPRLLASLQQDVIAAFQKSYVARCVDALARELLRCESISGTDAQAFIASGITEQQRIAVREQCCLSGSM